jgi:hypothetical protein
MIDIESGSAHMNVWHILKLRADFFHTFGTVIIEHRECYVSVKVSSVYLLIILMKVFA